MSEALAIPDDAPVIELLTELEKAGALDAVSLTLTDPDISYDRWESLGRFLGELHRRSLWYIADWINFGEEVFGQDAAQAVEATIQDRYSLVERTTGLAHDRLLRIASIGARVAKPRRRVELGFWIHETVAPLEPAEQEEWLKRAVDDGLSDTKLRAAIKEAKGGALPTSEPPPGGDGLTKDQRIAEAARHVYHQARLGPDGEYRVPVEPMKRLGATIGEGE